MVDLRISAEALASLRGLQKSNDFSAKAVFVGAMLEHAPPPAMAQQSIEEYIANGLDHYKQLPARASARWIVWIGNSGSVPSLHLRKIEGIPFAVPEEVIALIGDRELVLHDGSLRFEPEYGELIKPDPD